jgi:hypothetical protein
MHRPSGILLRSLLGSEGEPLPDLARSFFAGTAELIETPWASAAVPDFAFPQTEGRRPDDLDRILAFNTAYSHSITAFCGSLRTIWPFTSW